MLRSFPKHTQNEHKKSPLLAHHRKQVLFYGQKMLGQSGLPARFPRSFRFFSHELQGVYLQCLHGCNRLSSLPNDRLLRKSLCILRSVSGLPFCTSAPQVSRLFSVCALLEPVAPPHPSLPVAPPIRSTTSPFSGTERTTFSAGAAPTTKPVSSRLAT